MKTIGLPELEADALDRIQIVARRRLPAEGMQDAPLMRGQIRGVAGGEAAQQHRITSLGLGDAALPLRRRGRRVKSQHLVDELQIPVVVDKTLVGRYFGVDPDPEAHVRFQLGRMREEIGLVGGSRADIQNRRQQQA